ncbi:glycosyltransferase [Roseiconus lacunae]|uniref:glycosyltransferase n=1 Tax=Roseiconus lacunae TaxID=2605694 RepID=UPI001E3FE95A|nr:glycosyltransferase [Roseiconus lacunae]MCD0459859.1 glycosyltransferase [Roseiconus lacunae]
MKITFLLSNPGLGGIERRLSWVVPELNALGHDANILNLRSHSNAAPLWEQSGVPVHSIPHEGVNRWLVAPRLYKTLRKQRPDVIHIYGLRANLVGRVTAKLACDASIISGQVSTDDWRKWYHVSLDRMTSPCVDRYMTNADAVSRAFARREKIPDEKLVTIYNGIDVNRYCCDGGARTAAREALNLTGNDVIFMMIANVRPAKNHAMLLDAVARLRSITSGFKVVLVGKDFTGSFEDEIRSRNLDDSVQYVGYQSDAGRLWPAADVAVLTSRWEGFPFSLLEAMASGLPVIATDVGGVSELIADQKSGFVVPPDAPDSLCESMRLLVESPDKRSLMGRRGRERAKTEFGLSTMLDRLVHLYQSVTEAR